MNATTPRNAEDLAQGQVHDGIKEEKQHQDSIGYGQAQSQYQAAGWTSVLPLPKGKKEPPPTGFTGKKAGDRWPTPAEYATWIDQHDDGNLALRMPPGVLGIDVDDYGDKHGAETLAKIEAQAGPLPETWISTSRDDGVSGIRLYRVPEGLTWKNQPDMEVIHSGHRYAVAWPSIHPNGQQYRWNRAGVPTVAELPELPEKWIEALTDSKSTNDGAHLDDGADVIELVRREFTKDQASKFVQEHGTNPLKAATKNRSKALYTAGQVWGHFIPEFMNQSQVIAILTEVARDIGMDDPTRSWPGRSRTGSKTEVGKPRRSIP
jgi:Bifunctional DNA primase/polymerase, N-terminal